MVGYVMVIYDHDVPEYDIWHMMIEAYQWRKMMIEEKNILEDMEFRDRLFKEDNMYTRVKSFAQSENLTETYKALPYMKEHHAGQFRKKGKHSDEMVEYINHPLLLACHAHAMGIRDDKLIAALLLHDVVEDTDVSMEELPFSDEVKELVRLVTFAKIEGMTKEESKAVYYDAIGKNGKACVIKVIDRCNNVSTMGASFSKEKLVNYINETERYILPLLTTLKNNYPEYSDVAFIAKYHILSVIETIKNLIVM